MSFRWPNLRRVVGRHPQSVTDYDVDTLRAEDSMQLEASGVPPEPATPTLPVNVAGVTGFQNLPDELLEQIFQKLSGSSRKNYFAVSGVSRAWRRLGNKMFFSSPWDTPHLICHPNQLFCLSPRTPSGSRSGLLKCFVRRDAHGHTLPNGRVGRRISFFLGKDPLNTSRARFLLCAVQPTRHVTLIYLNSKCEGPPCARLISNFLCTSYSLENGMSFSLQGPGQNCQTPITNSTNTAHGNGTTSNSNMTRPGSNDASSGGDGTSRRTVAVESAFDEVSSTSPAVVEQEITTPPSSPTTTTSVSIIPPLLMSLRYRARVRGLMQPRRMDVALPNPRFMACGAFPKMQRVHSGSGGGGVSGTTTAPATDPLHASANNSSGVGMWLKRPSLGYISSVAALERPPPSQQQQPQTGETTPELAQGSLLSDIKVGGDDGGGGADDDAGPSCSTTPSAAFTSLAASPEIPRSLNAEPSSPSLPPPPAAAPSSATAAAVPLWRRALGLDRNQTAARQHRFPFKFNVFSSPRRTRRRNALGASAGTTTAATATANFLHARRGATFDESALPVCLVNKAPHWNEALRCWCLNFRGRVKLASVKNFQLVKDGDEEAKVSMQFGKFDKDMFILDFNPMTLSAIQAFAIALTTFDSKVTL